MMGSPELIKNSKFCNESAWGIFVSILEKEVRGFPSKYRCCDTVLQAAFDLRRNSFLRIIAPEEASAGIISLINELPEENQDLLTEPEGPVVFIRDFFTKPREVKGNRRHH